MGDALSSLPNELLIRILTHLDNIELHRLVIVSRTLHTFSLYIIFKRCIPGVLDGRLDLNTGQTRQSLLSALHGALNITDIPVISVKFDSPDLSRLFQDIRILTSLVERLPKITDFEVDFTAQASRHKIPNTWVFFEGLRRLFNTVLDKGCVALTVVEKNGSWGALNIPLKEKRRSLDLSKVLRPFGKAFGVSSKGKSEKGSQKEKDEGSSEGEPGPSPSVSHKNWTRETFLNGQLLINTQMLFHPPWLDWTLSLINLSALHTLTIRATPFSKNFWAEIFPQVHIPGLVAFNFATKKITMGDLAGFLKRHVEKLEMLSLVIPRPSVESASGNVSTEPNLVGFHFPKLVCVYMTIFCVEWFFQTVMASPLPSPATHTEDPPRYRLFIPSLEMISIMFAYSDKFDTFYTQLDDLLEILAQLVRSEPPKTEKLPSGRRWANRLNIDTPALSETPHNAWLESHSSRGASSPLRAFRTVSAIPFFNTPS